MLLTLQGIPKIGDFGLAKRVVGSGDASVDALAGTPHYMAPELFHGEPASHASDVYALGVCYFVLLTGRFPFPSSSLPELMRRVATDPFPRIRAEFPDIPLEMTEVLGRLMDRTPANRPQDAFEAAQLLRAVCGEVRDLDSLLRAAFPRATGVAWTRDGERYRLVLELPDDRRQTVFVEPSPHAVAERLLLIYSICCESNPAWFEAALRLNGEMSHGGLAIRDVDGAARFVMLDTYPRATVDAEEVRRSVLEVAHRADAVEKLLTGRDVH